MEHLIVGIDPGATGAIALIDTHETIIDIIDFPGDPMLVGELIDREIHAKHGLISLAGLEAVHANSLNGCKGNFKLGGNYNVWRAMLAYKGIPTYLVPPQTWQKGVLFKDEGKDTKERSLAAARRMYPGSPYFKRQKDHGRADALHIAAFTAKRYKRIKG